MTDWKEKAKKLLDDDVGFSPDDTVNKIAKLMEDAEKTRKLSVYIRQTFEKCVASLDALEKLESVIEAFEYSYGKNSLNEPDFLASENGEEGDAYRLANQIYKILGVED